MSQQPQQQGSDVSPCTAVALLRAARVARFARGVPAGFADSGPRTKPSPVGTVI